jgi:hypothetical protein
MLASEMLSQFDQLKIPVEFEADADLTWNLLLVLLVYVRRSGGRLAVDLSEDKLLAMLVRPGVES